MIIILDGTFKDAFGYTLPSVKNLTWKADLKLDKFNKDTIILVDKI